MYATLATEQPTTLGAAPDAPVEGVMPDWSFLIGSYVGSWVGGAVVGYMVGRNKNAAVIGGVAASGVWGIGETIGHMRARAPWLSITFLALGAGSLAYAWRSRR